MRETQYKFTFQERFAREHFCEGVWIGLSQGLWSGEIEGLQDVLFALLGARGLEVPNDVRRQINGCRDQAQFERWLRRAVFIDDAEKLIT
ncbi:hypothetical protein E1264_14090 [Actinomadura sp. KC216]|uniref:hypothetical protein n=1 Tax=Actinomadura sp. KC216 TaxID=2530370 RepID=UPI00104D9FF6|nr:hypothetical protein [Actinomadura sp. KC216]TDB87610.1 hypothetical protein E1264_14090 [Actinomadura sp. KC216]